MLAASQGKNEAIQLLVDHGSNIDWIDLHGRTALQLAAIHCHLDTVNLLVSLGADEAHKVFHFVSLATYFYPNPGQRRSPCFTLCSFSR